MNNQLVKSFFVDAIASCLKIMSYNEETSLWNLQHSSNGHGKLCHLHSCSLVMTELVVETSEAAQNKETNKTMGSNTSVSSVKKEISKRLTNKFNEHREKGLFIDCLFRLPNENNDIKAHRLVVAKYSKLFDEYFKTHSLNPNNLHVPIPFDIKGLFNQMINFMYEDKIEFQCQREELIDLYALAMTYGYEILARILNTMIKTFLDQSPHTILSFTSAFLQYELNYENVKEFPGLFKNYEALMKSQHELAKYLENQFKHENISEIYSCVTPYLFSEYISLLNISNVEKVHAIDEFVNQYSKELTIAEKKSLQEKIDWNQPKAYILCSKYQLDWVLPDVYKPLIKELIDHRRQITTNFENIASNMDKSTVNSWYAFNWIKVVGDSENIDDRNDIELIEYLGTLGYSSKFVNPVDSNFIIPNEMARTGKKQYINDPFDIKYSFDLVQKDKYSLYSLQRNNTYNLGFSMQHACFVPHYIRIELPEKKPPITDFALSIVLPNNDVRDYKFENSKTHIVNLDIHDNSDPITGFLIKSCLKETQQNIRVKEIRLYGIFIP